MSPHSSRSGRSHCQALDARYEQLRRLCEPLLLNLVDVFALANSIGHTGIVLRFASALTAAATKLHLEHALRSKSIGMAVRCKSAIEWVHGRRGTRRYEGDPMFDVKQEWRECQRHMVTVHQWPVNPRYVILHQPEGSFDDFSSAFPPIQHIRFCDLQLHVVTAILDTCFSGRMPPIGLCVFRYLIGFTEEVYDDVDEVASAGLLQRIPAQGNAPHDA